MRNDPLRLWDIRKPALALGFALSVLTIAPGRAVAQDVSGAWKIDGRVLVFSFTLTCNFSQHGEMLDGVCYDGGTNKAHPLTTGKVVGDKVSWTYQSRYKDHPFDAVYAGVVTGRRIRGSLHAPGHSGGFIALKE